MSSSEGQLSPEDGDRPDGGLAPGSFAAGHRVGQGRYTLLRRLGEGGMAVVWLAQDERLREQVALKFLPQEIQHAPAALHELRQETVRSQRLSHPNIVRIHDLQEAEGEPAFISMEYVDGPTLHTLQAQQVGGVFGWESLRPWVQQLCEALAYAHAEQVVHRDLKPSNLMVDSKGRLKLADFGIAAVVSDSLQQAAPETTTYGTLAYASPQHLSGALPSASDDLYALGATLYELLTGRPPFYTGDLAAQVREVPAPSLSQRLAELGLPGTLPVEAEAMIMACLAKERGQRPTDARAAAAQAGLVGPTDQGLSALGISEVHATEPAPPEAVISPPDEPPQAPLPGAAAYHRISLASVLLWCAAGLAAVFFLIVLVVWINSRPTGREHAGTNRVAPGADQSTEAPPLPCQEDGIPLDEPPAASAALPSTAASSRPAQVNEGPGYDWAASLGRTLNSPMNLGPELGLAVDALGNSYVAAWFEQQAYFGSTTRSWRSAGLEDLFIAKLDPMGKVLWVHKAGGPGRDLARAVAVDAAGHCYVTGSFIGSVTFQSGNGQTQLNSALRDPKTPNLFLAKYDAAGRLQWVRQTAGAGSACGWALSLAPGGGVDVTGDFSGRLDFGGTSVDLGGRNYVIARCDDTGWRPTVTTGGGRLNGYATGLAMDSVGNWFVRGVRRPEPNSGTIEQFVARVGLSGAPPWCLLTQGQRHATGGGMAVDPTNGVWVAGEETAGHFVARYGSTPGKELWKRKTAGGGRIYAGGLVVDRLGNGYVTGGFEGSVTFDETTRTAVGGRNVFLAKYDAAGKVLWVRADGGGGADCGVRCVLDSQGRVYVAGWHEGPAQFGRHALPDPKGYGVFVARLSAE